MTRRQTMAVAAAAFVSLIVAGCANENDPLAGTRWRLAEWTLSSLSPADFTITAAFADGQITGRSGVNSYGGRYELGPDDAFSAGPLSSTEIAGPPAAMRAERAYMTLLGQARSYALADNRLTLFDQGGNESLIFAVSAG